MPLALPSRIVRSVMGAVVDNTDALRPVVNADSLGAAAAKVAGVTGLTVNNLDPLNPVIESIGFAPFDDNITTTYFPGDSVWYNGGAWQCISVANGNDGTPDMLSAKWIQRNFLPEVISAQIAVAITTEIARADAAYDADGAAAAKLAPTGPMEGLTLTDTVTTQVYHLSITNGELIYS